MTPDYQALLAEVAAELPKPFDLDQVLALVHRLAAGSLPESRDESHLSGVFLAPGG